MTGKGQGRDYRGSRGSSSLVSFFTLLFSFFYFYIFLYLLNVLELLQWQKMAQSPEWTWAWDICMSQVPICYIYIFALLNYFLLDWYGNATRMKTANNHIQDNDWGFKMQMMHLKCLSKFFSFFFWYILSYFIIIGLRHPTTTSTTPWQQQQGLRCNNASRVISMFLFSFYLYILSYFITIGSIYLEISDHHYHHPCHPRQ